MAKKELTPVEITLDTIVPAGVSAEDDGMWFANSGRMFLHITGGAGALKITVDCPSKCNFGFDTEHDIEITPGAGEELMAGPFPKSRFDDGDGRVQIGFAAGCEADGMVLQVLELP